MSLILHHYPLSPFSEKIRSMLGYTETEWQSCLTSEAPPRGKLDLLSGGYNRIPIAQIGADIFCDSNIIADELASMSDTLSLANEALEAGDLEQRQWLEGKLFFACVNKAFSLSLLKRIAKDKGIWNLGRFLKDRIQMGMKATVSMGSPKSAGKHIRNGAAFITENLHSGDFVGGETPNILDFSAYHCFWFLTEVGQKKDLNKYPQVRSWYRRMQALTSRPSANISIDKAIDQARASQPRKLDARYTQDHRIGSKVVISPSDYRQVPVSGTLVGADKHRWIIARETDETGTIHLHFPTHAYDISLRLAQH